MQCKGCQIVAGKRLSAQPSRLPRLGDIGAGRNDEQPSPGYENMNKAAIEIFTDRACKGNPGVGGWGALLRTGEHERCLAAKRTQQTTAWS